MGWGQGGGRGGGWGAEGAGGRQQREEVSTHPPCHRDPDEEAGWEDTCRGKRLPGS